MIPGLLTTNAFPGLTFLNPVAIATPPGETNRLFIVEKHGRIVVITNLAKPARTIFMDISARVSVVASGESADLNNEEGLVGIAFHPGYASNRLFYVFYTGPATNGGTGLHDILAQYQASASNPNQGDPNSEVRLIAQIDPASNHNGGQLQFGPDGYLYVGLGDGGTGN
ncbi:MAG: PQQ-dependent sugar dehydrogenase, partial [Verrucomicrobiota bacterium]